MKLRYNGEEKIPVSPPAVQMVVPRLSSVRVRLRRPLPESDSVVPAGTVVVPLPRMPPPVQVIDSCATRDTRRGATIITASAPSLSCQMARLKNSHHITMASAPRTPPIMAMAPASGKMRGVTNRIRQSSTAAATPGHNRRGLWGSDAVCWLVINGPDASGVQLVP